MMKTATTITVAALMLILMAVLSACTAAPGPASPGAAPAPSPQRALADKFYAAYGCGQDVIGAWDMFSTDIKARTSLDAWKAAYSHVAAPVPVPGAKDLQVREWHTPDGYTYLYDASAAGLDPWVIRVAQENGKWVVTDYRPYQQGDALP